MQERARRAWISTLLLAAACSTDPGAGDASPAAPPDAVADAAADAQARVCGDLRCTSGEAPATCAVDCDTEGSCLAQKCAADTTACAADPKCAALRGCLRPCQEQDCAQRCASHAGPKAVATFNAWIQCGQDLGCLAPGSGSSPGAHYCDTRCGLASSAPSGCRCDELCKQVGNCCAADGSKPSSPAKRCGGSSCAACNDGDTRPTCGNGVCEDPETPQSCPSDC